MTRLIAVGSTNPVKVQAVSLAAQQFWNDVDVISFKTPSGVSDMPMSKVEARRGAKNRAIQARLDTDAWLGVGNEGGTCWMDGDLYLFSSTYVTDGRNGSYGGETLMRLPEFIVKKFGDGNEELGLIMDQITGKDNIKQKEGAVGYLSNNTLTRTDIFRTSTIMAFSNWIEKSG